MTIAANKVVVGYDTSEESAHAVRWGATVAKRREAPLVVLCATGWVKPPAGMDTLTESGDRLAQRTADKGAAIAREHEPDIEVEPIGVQNTAIGALESYSLESQLIVLGHRGAGALRLGRLGSVAFAIANHVSCPVAVVRSVPRALPTAEYPSVVAVDGSKQGDVALDRAARWADESGSLLRIVTAWRTPLVHPWSSISIDEDNKVNREASRKAEESAREVAERAEERARAAFPGLKTEVVVDEGRPAEVIVDASRDASLVIVGARGRGDFASLILGSVSREVIEHAEGAVYVVR